MLKHFTYKKIRILVLISAGTAVLESNLARQIEIIRNPGLPWAADISLIAILYIWIGYTYKNKIKDMFYNASLKLDILAIILLCLIITFLKWNYTSESLGYYYFDMKPRNYENFFGVILIPVMFGIVFSRMLFWAMRLKAFRKLEELLSALGQMTLPIMFMHIPINTFIKSKGYDYGWCIYTALGLGIPVVITLIGKNNKFLCKILGLEKIQITKI